MKALAVYIILIKFNYINKINDNNNENFDENFASTSLNLDEFFLYGMLGLN